MPPLSSTGSSSFECVVCSSTGTIAHSSGFVIAVVLVSLLQNLRRAPHCDSFNSSILLFFFLFALTDSCFLGNMRSTKLVSNQIKLCHTCCTTGDRKSNEVKSKELKIADFFWQAKIGDLGPISFLREPDGRRRRRAVGGNRESSDSLFPSFPRTSSEATAFAGARIDWIGSGSSGSAAVGHESQVNKLQTGRRRTRSRR
jgi:hypothetical protein